ncbi:hypothetical protein ACJMK2_033942 [Sinanodonta woodiana]|uniref:Metalloendopeptidase n=1 Tax=Sinanodonta woodiana TaxID=1069815 RepID=A0ABD3WQL1_SINWO
MYIFLFLWVATVTCWPSTSALPVQEQRERRGIPSVIPKPLRDPIENTGVKRVLLEGDIYVDRRRNAVRVFEQTWFTRIIPFDIHPSFDSHDVTEIQLAMQEIMSGSNLCVKFTPRTTEEDFLYLTKLDGCWSAVGRRGGNQTVSVGDGCNKKGIIMHELMHALGFWHEHNRPDRDNYINILWNNIIPEHTQDFDLTNKSQTLDSPYDYLSIMHYKANTFSKDPATLDTITPKNILVDKQSLGQREYLSDNDKVRIRRLYQCNDTMCPYPNIPNGLADGTNLSVGSSIKFSCKSGYMLIGNPDRSCMKNGAWSGAEPKCLYRPVVLHYCNFDTMDLCSWTQQILDKNQIQWTWWSKETPTDDTGPYVDHTRQGAPGYYLYMESSDPARTGNYALLTSPAFPVSSGLCMSFYYFMYGRKVGSLEVFMRQGLYPDTLIWSISGNQSAEWNIAFITLKIPYITNFQILIKATRADSPYGDIAIDDVLIGRCQDLMDIYSPQGSLQTILTKPADGTINYKFGSDSFTFYKLQS